jgi:hypothetical protein
VLELLLFKFELLFDDNDGWRIFENELIVDENELVGEFIGFIIGFDDIKADVGLWLNGITKRNLPIPSFFAKLS